MGIYSDPLRDPRFHTASVVFGAVAQGSPVGADDALRAAAFEPDALPEKLAFDHRRIIGDFLAREKRRGRSS